MRRTTAERNRPEIVDIFPPRPTDSEFDGAGRIWNTRNGRPMLRRNGETLYHHRYRGKEESLTAAGIPRRFRWNSQMRRSARIWTAAMLPAVDDAFRFSRSPRRVRERRSLTVLRILPRRFLAPFARNAPFRATDSANRRKGNYRNGKYIRTDRRSRRVRADAWKERCPGVPLGRLSTSLLYSSSRSSRIG